MVRGISQTARGGRTDRGPDFEGPWPPLGVARKVPTQDGAATAVRSETVVSGRLGLICRDARPVGGSERRQADLGLAFEAPGAVGVASTPVAIGGCRDADLLVMLTTVRRGRVDHCSGIVHAGSWRDGRRFSDQPRARSGCNAGPAQVRASRRFHDAAGDGGVSLGRGRGRVFKGNTRDRGSL